MPQLVVSHGLTPSEKGWSTGIMIPNMAEKEKNTDLKPTITGPVITNQ